MAITQSVTPRGVGVYSVKSIIAPAKQLGGISLVLESGLQMLLGQTRYATWTILIILCNFSI